LEALLTGVTCPSKTDPNVKLELGPSQLRVPTNEALPETVAHLPDSSLITNPAKTAYMIFIYSEGLLETSQIKIILRSAGNLTTKRGPFRINFERQGPKGWLAYGLT
jgi:hypothetical protein